MEFRETLLAAQRNQQQKSSENQFYKTKFDPPKKEQKSKDKLSANIQKFLAKKDEEEKQKKLEAQRKREELLAMRDPKALRKIQKTLKVIKSANKSVIEDAVDRNNTAVTREGPEQPDQDDYGYESQEAAALYEKMMQKYSKIPDEPKFPVAQTSIKRDLNGTRERVKHALQHEDDPVPHKRKRRTENGERELSPPTKYEPEKKKDDKPEKPKFRKPAPPPMDFNQLLKLAEQKKSAPIDVAPKETLTKSEPERLMTKRQKKEYEEEMARRQRRQERLDAEKGGNRKVQKDERSVERDRKTETGGFARIPKLSDRTNGSQRNDSPKLYLKEKDRQHDKERVERIQKEKAIPPLEKTDREKANMERLDKLKAERDRIDREMARERLLAERDRIEREMEMLNNKDRLEKSKSKFESKAVDRPRPAEKTVDRKVISKEPMRQDMKKSIDLKSQNTYRIDKNTIEKKMPVQNKDGKYLNGQTSQSKPVSKSSMGQKEGTKPSLQGKQRVDSPLNGQNSKRLPDNKGMSSKKPDDRKPQAGPSKASISNSFDFDKHVSTLGKNAGRQFPPDAVRRKPQPNDKKKPQRRIHSDSEYDSEMDDFIDDGDENMDYSRHIKEIFGYDKSRYQDMDDDDDPNMESNFAQQQREEYISKKHGIMEDLEDMRLEAMEKKKSKKKRRISDEDD